MDKDSVKMTTIQAVDRALQVLEILGQENHLTLADLNKKIKVNKASLSRLLYTLVQNGYVSKNETSGEYSLTLKPYEIGLNAVQNLDKLSLINSTLVDIYKQCGRIAQFSIEDHDQLLCLQSIGSDSSQFSVYTNIGHRSPLYSTSAGKALLSAYTNGEIIEKWNHWNVQPLTVNTLTDMQNFLQNIGDVRQKGYATDIEENEYNVFCIGSIVKDFSNNPIGAISISGNRMTEEDETDLSNLLLSSCKRLSELLGYVSR